jgi:putative sigma-54 modulation protein
MQLTISGHQIDLTDSMKNYIGEKMQRIERHFDHLNSIDVVLHVEKIHHKAEATINAKGVTLHAHADSENMYASIDDLTDKLDSQVRKHKEKITDHHRGNTALKFQELEGMAQESEYTEYQDRDLGEDYSS